MVTNMNNIGSDAEWVGLSTDTKPTNVPNGAMFLEMDTATVYVYNGASSTWVSLSGGE